MGDLNRDILVTAEARAIALQKVGNIVGAAREWEFILEHDPSWEHGSALYSLAGCYEDLGYLAKARELYMKALAVEPNPLYLDGLASHLYLYGEAKEAFEAFIQVIQLEFANAGSAHIIEEVRPVLVELGSRLGLTQESIEKSISNAVERGRSGLRPNLSLWGSTGQSEGVSE